MNNNLFYFLQYPFYLDIGFILPLVIPLFLSLKNNLHESLKYTFKGFKTYSFLIIAIAIINYLGCYSEEYFSLFSFIKNFFKILALYLMIRLIVYTLNHQDKVAHTSIKFYSYALLGSIFLADLFYYFSIDTSFVLKIFQQNNSVRYSGFLSEPAHISILGIAFIIILINIKNKQIPFSSLLAFFSAAFISKSFSTFVLLLVITLVTFFHHKKIIFDKNPVIIVLALLLTSITIFDYNRSEVSKLEYYTKRLSKALKNQDNSTRYRLLDSSVNISKEINIKQILLGVGIGQTARMIKYLNKYKIGSKYDKDIHLAFMSLFVSIGFPLGIILIFLFLDIRSPVKIFPFLSITILSGGWLSLPIALAFVLSSKSRSRKLWRGT